MSHLCSPLRYPGGKNCIFPFVSRFFYENNLIGADYAEPYAGGAGLALRLLFEEYVNRIYINDLDRSIYAFWDSVINRNEEFCRWIRRVDVSVKSWREYKEIHNNSASAELFELAKATFFLNRTNVSGVITGGVIGGFSQEGKYKISVRFNKSVLVERLKKIEGFKKRIILSNQDGLSFIKKLDPLKRDIFIYLDPPYFLKGADLYMNYYSKKDHQKLSLFVQRLSKKWMVSYDNNDFIINLYANKKSLVHKLSQNTSNRVGDELLIFSDGVRFKNSAKKLKFPKLIKL